MLTSAALFVLAAFYFRHEMTRLAEEQGEHHQTRLRISQSPH